MKQFRHNLPVIVLVVLAITFFVGCESDPSIPESRLLHGQEDTREVVRKGMTLTFERPKEPIRPNISAPEAYKKVETLYEVPDGKRLVIEQISGTSEEAKVTLGIDVSEGVGSSDSGSIYYIQGTPQSIGYVALQLTRIYADSGAIVSAVVDPGDTPPTRLFLAYVTFSGYLEDVKQR